MLRGFDKKGLRRNAIVKSLTLCLLILFVFIPTRGESLVCAGLPERYYSEDKLMIAPLSAEGYRSVLVVFAKFRGEAPGDSTAPAYARDLFDPDVRRRPRHMASQRTRAILPQAPRRSSAPERCRLPSRVHFTCVQPISALRIRS